MLVVRNVSIPRRWCVQWISPWGDIIPTRYHSVVLLLRDTNVRDVFTLLRIGDPETFHILQPEPKHHHTPEMSLFLRDVHVPGQSFLCWAERMPEIITSRYLWIHVSIWLILSLTIFNFFFSFFLFFLTFTFVCFVLSGLPFHFASFFVCFFFFKKWSKRKT
jgi:hypothetical protein